MRIAIGCDHRGCDVKDKVVELLRKLDHEVVDEGTHECASVDYPD
ncbi:MAG: RpiB/LacA/LacB family sugar-phosphate isomerase, partial [Planctomycetes bacterium]|nr:RpiB/LacA/LacB family sugar-phosphate isomerase [Planctomycetota bacterium]